MNLPRPGWRHTVAPRPTQIERRLTRKNHRAASFSDPFSAFLQAPRLRSVVEGNVAGSSPAVAKFLSQLGSGIAGTPSRQISINPGRCTMKVNSVATKRQLLFGSVGTFPLEVVERVDCLTSDCRANLIAALPRSGWRDAQVRGPRRADLDPTAELGLGGLIGAVDAKVALAADDGPGSAILPEPVDGRGRRAGLATRKAAGGRLETDLTRRTLDRNSRRPVSPPGPGHRCGPGQDHDHAWLEQRLNQDARGTGRVLDERLRTAGRGRRPAGCVGQTLDARPSNTRGLSRYRRRTLSWGPRSDAAARCSRARPSVSCSGCASSGG